MTEIYLAGGQQRADIDPGKTAEWQHYARGLIVAIDLESGRSREVVSWVSPAEARPDSEASFVFKAGTLDVAAGRYYACTQTEVLVFEYPSFRRLHYVSLPSFNDVHHVAATAAGTLEVTSTGLDMVIEVGLDGRVIREFSVDEGAPWVRFSRDTDYRRVPTTKPHQYHPNFSFHTGGQLWATRCNTHDAVCLTAPGRIAVGTTCIHDGHVVGGTVYFTQVSGQIIEVDGAGRSVRRVHEIPTAPSGMPRGWCRGLEVLEDGLFLVGFSRLRPTKWKESVRWVKRELGGSGQGLVRTHIAAYDARRGAVVWETEVESAGLNAVFSIHAPDAAAVRAALQRAGA